MTPTPFTRVLVNVPSYISPYPQLGLLAFSKAHKQFLSIAIAKANSAPPLNCSVTSIPFLVWTQSPIRSAGGLGVKSPPSTSGHTGIRL